METTDEVCSLENKSCIPCSGKVPPLSTKETDKFLKELKGKWKLSKLGHLVREFTFSDFMGALNFANKIGTVAEKEGHHPDLTVAWGKCGVEIWTHKINGLTESDFILAAKIDSLSK